MSKRVGMMRHRSRAQYMSPLIRRASAATALRKGDRVTVTGRMMRRPYEADLGEGKTETEGESEASEKAPTEAASTVAAIPTIEAPTVDPTEEAPLTSAIDSPVKDDRDAGEVYYYTCLCSRPCSRTPSTASRRRRRGSRASRRPG